MYINDTGLGNHVFTGSRDSKVSEIELFEIAGETVCSWHFLDSSRIGQKMQNSVLLTT
jgi:hypothetical protein